MMSLLVWFCERAPPCCCIVCKFRETRNGMNAGWSKRKAPSSYSFGGSFLLVLLNDNYFVSHAMPVYVSVCILLANISQMLRSKSQSMTISKFCSLINKELHLNHNVEYVDLITLTRKVQLRKLQETACIYWFCWHFLMNFLKFPEISWKS